MNNTNSNKISKSTKNSILSKDFSSYIFNNWMKTNDNVILNEIDMKGGSLWLTGTGALAYKLSKNRPISILTNNKQANLVFTNYLNKDVFLLKEPTKSKENKEDKDSNSVSVKDLIMVQADMFNPFVLKEFYKKKDLYYRNIFKPSKYLQICAEKKQYDDNPPFIAITKLISHLVNYDKDRFTYVINWLAYFFQGLKKSQVALVLRGDQGAGKGIFFNEVISPLFGEEYCTTVNDKSLRSSFLGGIIENKIFFNLDEISQQKTENSNIKNFLKALVTNESITAEKKFITLENVTKIYGQVLITSNEPYVLDVEDSDRRYTIFTTSNNLLHNDYLGYKTYKILSDEMKKGLKEFAIYLKSYDVDLKLANQALNTPEKDLLKDINRKKELEKQQRLQKDVIPIKMQKIPTVPNAIFNFAQAIRLLDNEYFSIIKYDNEPLYTEIIEDLSKRIFKIKNLLPCFQLINGNDMRIKYVSILIKELTKFDPYQFHHRNYKQYKDEETIIDYIQIIPYHYYS